MVLSIPLRVQWIEPTVIGAYRSPSAPPCAIDHLSGLLSAYLSIELVIMGYINLDSEKLV